MSNLVLRSDGIVKKAVELQIDAESKDWNDPIRFLQLMKPKIELKQKVSQLIKKNFCVQLELTRKLSKLETQIEADSEIEVPLTQTSIYDFHIDEKMPMFTELP